MTDQARADIANEFARTAIKACIVIKVMTSNEAGALIADCLQTLKRSTAGLEPVSTGTDMAQRLAPATANIQPIAEAKTGKP